MGSTFPGRSRSFWTLISVRCTSPGRKTTRIAGPRSVAPAVSSSTCATPTATTFAGSSQHEGLAGMSDGNITRARIWFDQNGQPVVLTSDHRPDQPSTDWERLATMTDEEVEANAASDPDAQLLTPEQLARLRPVPAVRDLRIRLHLTQGQFADRSRSRSARSGTGSRGAASPIRRRGRSCGSSRTRLTR